MMRSDFAIFILTHGRPDNVVTLKTLKRQGYTGKVYIVIDNEDVTADRYRENFGDMVVEFDKIEIAQRFDEGDNFHDRRTILHARNASYEIAKSLGIRYFLQLDDDYGNFSFKFDSKYVYNERMVKNLDRLLLVMIEYLESVPQFWVIAFAQNGDFIGGREGTYAKKIHLKRKAMNTFFCDTHRRLEFMGRMNEDVNTYVVWGSRGRLMGTIFSAAIAQEATQTGVGGMSNMYKAYGTYVKTFYTFMYAPSCVKIGTIGYIYRRIHHHVIWEQTTPKILHERHRKSEKRSSIGSGNNGTPIPA